MEALRPLRTTGWLPVAVALATALCACSGDSVVGGPDDAASVRDATDVVDAPSIDAADTGGAMDAPDAPDVVLDAGPTRCTADANCASAPEGEICNLATGLCVRCLPSRDTCPSDRYCDPGTLTCFAGCRADDGCRPVGADGGATALRCDSRTHTCVACVTDDHCPPGNLCRGSSCVPGCDATRACPAGQTCCTGGCVDTQSNVSSCGTCGRACAAAGATSACVAGACAVDHCDTGLADCDGAAANGCEVNLQTDVAQCGSCGMRCPALDNALPACSAGACVVSVCSGGFGDCDGAAANGCETELRDDPTHCGACDTACPPVPNASPTCTASLCGFTCVPGFADCDGAAANGCEVDTRTSATHCGGCGTACAAGPNSTSTCIAGACAIGSCAAGFADCDGTASNGCEVNTQTNNANCGRCGTACSASEVCALGRCGAPCPPGQTRCGTTCVVTSNDPANCGACGTICPSGRLCGGGTCVSTCGAGQVVCGRSCATLATDPGNCGACGRVCPSTQSCVAGACALVCPSGVAACGLVCADFQSDNAHCGRCNNACATTHRCGAGACQLVCPAAQTVCGGACVDLMSNSNHCGACGRVCPSGCYLGACGSLAAIDAGRTNNCIFYTSGRVFCFGQRTGLLPSSSTSLYHYWTPQVVNDGLGRSFDAAVELVLAQDRACVRASNGTVSCWGAGNSVGNVAGLTNVVDIDAREASSFFAATRDGRVFTWNGIPRPASNPPAVVAGIADAVEVAGGSGFGCARTIAGGVRCWGANANGQLGNGTVVTSAAPVVVAGLTDAVTVTAGYSHACAIRANRSVVCWGRNDVGQVGDGTVVQRLTPVPVTGLANVQQLRAGENYTCAVLANGGVRCWGGNAYGQLGAGTMTAMQTTPVAVAGLPPSRHVTVYQHHGCAIGRDNVVRCWGQNFWGEAGGGTEAQTTPAPVRGITGATDLQGGYHTGSGSEMEFHKCALLSGGSVQCWGSATSSNAYGQLGDGTLVARTTPAPVTGLTDATQIGIEGYHNCALRRGGTVVCWGNNASGQLGDGTTTRRASPVAVPGVANAAEVRLGRNHTCARLNNGTVSCWGYNFHGELGDGTMVNRATPRLVPGVTTATQLAMGANHTCVRLADGRVQCWGRNIEGQLADGSNTNRFVPTLITYLPMPTTPAPVTGVTAIRCGQNICYARLTDGSARLWGNSNFRVVADGNGVINVPQWVSEGFGATCQYRVDNNVYCTGINEFGQLGIGRQSASESYTLVPGMYSRLQGGYLPGIPCAIERTTGRVMCWGPTRNGYLNNVGTPALDGYTRSPAVVPVP